MIRRRIRGILGATITACIPWTVLGLLTGMVFKLNLIPDVSVSVSRPIPGGIVTGCALAGALVGVVNGLTFSGLILAMERGKNVDELPRWRFAAWGGVATAGTLGYMFESVLAAGIGAGVGAVAGLAALWAARRAHGSLPATSSETA